MRALLVVLLALLVGCQAAEAAEDTGDCNMGQRTHFSRSGTIKVGSSRGGLGSAGGLGFQCALPEMGVYTVQFNLSAPRTDPTIATNARVICKAIIDWVVSGNYVRRVVHVTDGMSVTGTGEAVRVELVDDSVLLGPGTPPFDPIDYLVSVQVSEGSRASNPNPPYLLDREHPTGIILSPGVPEEVDIPQDIGASSVYVATGAAIGPDPIEPGMLAVQQVIVGAVAMAYDPRDFQWVPLMPGAITLRMYVDSTQTSESRVTVFWGIDG